MGWITYFLTILENSYHFTSNKYTIFSMGEKSKILERKSKKEYPLHVESTTFLTFYRPESYFNSGLAFLLDYLKEFQGFVGISEIRIETNTIGDKDEMISADFPYLNFFSADWFKPLKFVLYLIMALFQKIMSEKEPFITVKKENK